ncbi:MAG: D-alanine--D-alanine ligase family protein [Pyrinomonadaceae bacterium]
MPQKIRVGLIFGGRSGEHDISVRSACAGVLAIDLSRYEIVPIAIDKAGNWLTPEKSFGLLTPQAVGRWEKKANRDLVDDCAVAITGDSSAPRGLLTLGNAASSERLRTERVDVIFPVLHGTYGEDGTIQGLLEMADLAYVGCGVLASACGMDKVTMKILFRQAQLPVCEDTWFLRSAWEQDRARVLRAVSRKISYPCFVKPANLGSSVGISKAVDRAQLAAAIDVAARYDRKIVVERGINAREIECAVLGNEHPEASLPGEYVVHDERARFLDYTEKYSNTGRVEFVVPAPLTKSLTSRIRQLAIKAFQAIDGAGLARVDFFIDRDSGELYVNELNTMPGLTDVSGYPKMWHSSGLNFTDLLDRLIALALERHRERSRNVTSLT